MNWGGGNHPQWVQIHVFRQFWGISLIKKRHCWGWCPMMTAGVEHDYRACICVRSTSDPVEALQARLDRFPWIFLRNIQTWNSATPIFKQVFQLDDAKLLHEKCMFQHFHPFQNCCFGYQELRILKFLEALIKSWDWFVGSFIGIATADWRAADWKGVDKVSLVVKAKGWLIWVPRATDHRIHGTGIFRYLHLPYFAINNQPNVGKYTSPMDPMGSGKSRFTMYEL